MSQPILEIKADKSVPGKTKAHLLPCRIHHDGSVEPAEPFWAPREDADGKNTAYFRGRKLHGQKVKLPDGYRGVVAERQQPKGGAESRQREDVDAVDVDSEEQQAIDMGSIETKAEFDEIIVWGHEATADAATDNYVRSIEEWLVVAEQIHSYPQDSVS